MSRLSPHRLRRILACLLLVIGWLVIGSLPVGSETPALAQGDPAVEYLIKVPSDISEADLSALAASYGGTIARRLPQINAILIRVPARQGRTLSAAKDPNLLHVEPNGVYYPLAPPEMTIGDFNDPQISYQQWALDTIDVWDAWDTATGAGRVVAVVDSGVDFSHPDLDDILNSIDDWDFANDDDEANDDISHGTHVTGIIGAEANNSLGIVGVAWGVEILPLKVFEMGSGNWDDIAAAIIYAADQGADVINLSLGGTDYSSTVRDAINYAVAQDVVVVAAAGNCNWQDPCPTSHIVYPAALDHVISTISLKDDEGTTTRAGYSDFNAFVDLAAPGDHILSTVMGGGNAYGGGTSAASPHAACVAALVLNGGHATNYREVIEAIQCTANDMGDAGRDDYYGWGALQATAAVNYIPGTNPCIPGVDHDDFDTARSITLDPENTYGDSVDTTAATVWTDDPTPCAGDGWRSVWYSLETGGYGQIKIDTHGSTYDTVLAVYSGTRGDLTATKCNNDDGVEGATSSVSLFVAPGETYHVAVTAYGHAGPDNMGTLDLNVTLTERPAGCYPTAPGSDTVICTTY
ncbi:MAG: S8 family serine peptidase [Anaerolineae bacterium]|nr:S8 family serine peptidase [Anaerolineae bacterium]